MKTIPKRLLSLLLVLVVVLGCLPTVYATTSKDSGVTEATTAAEAIPPAAPTEEETIPPSSSAPTISEKETVVDSTKEATEATEVPPESDSSQDMLTGSDAATYASTQNSIMLFDYTDNGNYTTVLKSQINISYKWNGTGSTLSCYLKNMGWHFARYNNTPYADDPLYCIEPHKNYAASTSGNSVDRDMTLDGSSSTTGGNIWYSLNANRREAIGLILLYSNQMWDHSISVSTTKKDDNPNVPLRIATQFLIFEIVTGLRDADTFQLKSSNECGTSGDIYYNAGVASVSGFAPKYNTLVSYVEAAMQIPSFTGASSSTAPTIELTGDTTSVYDSNGVLSGFSFTNGNGAKFTKSGNTLTITQTGTISESTVFKAKVGTCSSTGLVDGKLKSGADGMVTFEGLYPNCQYRLMETQAPEGYQLLAEAAYTGKLPMDKDLVLELTVVNARTYKLPNTGGNSLVWMPVSLLAACGTCCAILYWLKRKNRW